MQKFQKVPNFSTCLSLVVDFQKLFVLMNPNTFIRKEIPDFVRGVMSDDPIHLKSQPK